MTIFRIMFTLLFCMAAACNGTGFSGGTAKEKPRAKPKKTAAPADPGETSPDEGSTDEPGGDIAEDGKVSGDGSIIGEEEETGGQTTGTVGEETETFSQGTLFDDGSKADDDPIRIFEQEFAGSLQIKKLEPEQRSHIWGVTVGGEATYIRLEGDQVTATKKWTGVTGGGGGTRTYVTEGGVVIARTGGYLYWISPDQTPEGAVSGAVNTHRLAGVGSSDRVCVVSYRIDRKRWLGMGWGQGYFAAVPLEDQYPHKPLWDQKSETVKIGSGTWGYSCYIDQDRLIYYSQWTQMSGSAIMAIDLKTMTGVDPASSAPNGNFTSANIPDATTGPKGLVGKGSYALSGDRSGNVLNGAGYYTFAYDPKHKVVYSSGLSSGLLGVFPAGCFSNTENCTGFATFNMAQLGISVGPLSALQDGRVVGLQRGAGQVFVLGLKDPTDITKGITSTVVAQLGGDPYMYTDFTGATLYLTKTENSFDLTTFPKFDPVKPVRGIGFAWSEKPGKSKAFTDIVFKVRCYRSDVGRGEYELFDKVGKAGEQAVIKTDSCHHQMADKVDIFLEQVNGSDTLMNIRKVQVTVYQ